jgi:DNA-binding NarL/FixJ family response regulator
LLGATNLKLRRFVSLAMVPDSENLAVQFRPGSLIGLPSANDEQTQRNRAQAPLAQAQAELTHMARVTTPGELSASIAHEVTRRATAEGSAELKGSFAGLTPREQEVMGLVVTGVMNKQVAARPELSEITLDIHRCNVMRKMAAQSLADLVRRAEQLNVRDETIHRYRT